jgi:hypothetical protein
MVDQCRSSIFPIWVFNVFPHFVYYPRHKCKIAGCIGRRSLSFFPVCAGCTSVQEANILNNHNVLGTSEFAIHLLNEITLIFIDLRAC